MKIVTFIYSRDLVYDSSLLAFSFCFDEVMLIDDRDFRNLEISSFSSRTVWWKKMNWQNYMLKYVEITSPNTAGPVPVARNTSDEIEVMFEARLVNPVNKLSS